MELETHLIGPRAGVPNNARLPLLHYRNAVCLPRTDPAASFETLFASNGWGGGWRNGIFTFHHFHATAHEVLGIYSGEVTVCFGGPDGVAVKAEPGDVIVVPAGVAHKRVALSGALGVVGAYPEGQSPDLARTGAGAEAAAEQVRRVALPACDPVGGAAGPLLAHWHS